MSPQKESVGADRKGLPSVYLYNMHYCMASKIARASRSAGVFQEARFAMPRTLRPHPKPARRPTYIRAWRKHRGLTLAQLADRLATEQELSISEGQLSRIERGNTPYSQDILEAIASALRCGPATLLVRDPAVPDAIWSLWETLKPAERLQAVEIIKALGRTGTDS